MRVHLAIARALGRSLRDTYAYLGDEIELWEAEYLLNPWGPERDDLNAWKMASVIAGNRCPPLAWFDATRPAKAPLQSREEFQREIDKTAAMWPGAKRIKRI